MTDHPSSFDPENTHVLYRCTCGEQIELDEDVGGECQHCQAVVSPKLLNHDLALTMTISEGNSVSTLTGTNENDQSLLVGKQFGHFELLHPLGRGGMGQVYQALDTSLQRYVAVKVLRSGIGSTSNRTSSEKEIDMLLQEAIAQARVTHPNIVTIYYVGKQDGDPFLAMELITGEPLCSKISNQPMDYSEISSIATQITAALKYSYELDIIHGDIKPSNLMIQHDGVAKLSDFGMARRGSEQADGSLGGTPNYISLAMLRGEPSSMHSDMYALGVTFYEMSFGRLPIKLKGRTVDQWVQSHETAELTFPEPWPDRLPDNWKPILKQLLSNDPTKRYSAYEPLLADLHAAAPGSQVAAKRIPRMIAAMIDFLMVMLLVMPLQLFITLTPIYDIQANHLVANILVKLLEFTSLIGYTAMVFFWGQSFGRSLMHLRVVNQYGLPCSGRLMAIRSGMRMFFLWMLFAGNQIDGDVTSTLAAICQLLGVIFLLLDLAFLMIYDKGRSIHDLVCKTRVVLDT